MRPLLLLTAFLLGCTSSIRGPGSFRSSPRAPSSFVIDWPIDRARLTQKFKPSGRGKHWGIDLAAPKGTPIFAAHDGKVIYAGSGFSGYGKLVIIEFGNAWASFYSHLDRIHVSEGQWVTKGKAIATMGRTGRATGNHLHFELRHKKKPVNPLAYLP